MIQAIFHDVLLTGFGIAMCIAILFFTTNNPYQHMDSLTGLFDLNYFREQCSHYLQRKKSFHVLAVNLCHLKRINRILCTEVGNQALIQMAQMLQMRRICGFLKAHPELMLRIQNVKINLSPMELLKKGHIRQLIDTIRASGLPVSCFSFEITETVATDYTENLLKTIDLFTSFGIGLCLDDFGSGFANLNSVLKLPFSVIKMDRSLLSGICPDEKAASLYRNTCSVLRNMGFTVVAEGVETPAELKLLPS